MHQLGKDIFKLILSYCYFSKKYSLSNILCVCKQWNNLWKFFNLREKYLVIIDSYLFRDPYYLFAKYIVDSSYSQYLNFHFIVSEACHKKESKREWNESQRGWGTAPSNKEKIMELGWFIEKFELTVYENSGSSPNINFDLTSKNKIIGRLTHLFKNRININLESISNSLYYNSFNEPKHPLIEVNNEKTMTFGGIICFKINLKITEKFIINFFKNNPTCFFDNSKFFQILQKKNLNYQKRNFLIFKKCSF